MKCPKCESETTRRFEIVWEEGTSHSTSESKISGTTSSVNYGPQGGFSSGTIGGTASTSTTVQSRLAQECSPPNRRKLSPGIIVAMLGSLLIAMLIANGRSQMGDYDFQMAVLAGVGIFLIVLGIRRALMAKKFNREVFPELLSTWKRSWLCMKCGERYQVAN